MNLYRYLADKTAAVLAPHIGCDVGDKTFDRLWYGTYVFYINLCKTVLLVIVALLLGILPYVLVMALALGLLRTTSFGIHLESSLLCTALGFAYYLGGVYLAMHVWIPWPVKAVLLTGCLAAFLAYAPAETKKRPIPEHRRGPLKRLSVLFLVLIATAMFSTHSTLQIYSNLLLMGAVGQTVNILPVTYNIIRSVGQ